MTIHPYTRLFVLPSAPTADEDETEGYEVGDVVLSGGSFYDCSDATTGAAVWIERNPAAVPPAWGDITGTLSDQTDLQTELDDHRVGPQINAASAMILADAHLNDKLAILRNGSTVIISSMTFTVLKDVLTGYLDGTLLPAAHDHDATEIEFTPTGDISSVTVSAALAELDAEKIKHALATAANDFLVASGAGAFVKKTLAETITILRTSLDSIYAAIAKGVTNGDSHDHSGGDGAQIAYGSLSGTPTTEYNAEDIFRVNSSGASTFSGTINGTPSGASVVYNAGFSGNENALVPVATTQLAKLRLYNTTRGNSALISNCNTGTNTVTLTANAPANWANGDTITIASTTVTGGTGNWVDLEITSGPTGKSLMFLNCQWTDSGTVTSTTIARLHPTETFGTGKIFALPAQVSTFPYSAMALLKITSNVFTVSWIPSSTNTGTLVIREMGYLS